MKKYLLGILTLLSVNVSAAVLHVPETIIVSNIDGVERDESFFAEGAQIELTAGEHSITWLYQDFIEGDEDDHTKVKSELYVTFFTIKSESKELFIRTGELLELDEARAFSKNPEISIETIDSIAIKILTQSLFDVNSATKFKQLNDFTQSTSEELTQRTISPSSQNSNALGVELADKKQFPKLPITHTNCQSEKKMTSIEMLKCVWNNASKSERDAFVYFVLAEQQAIK
jgi:uncharacterized protein YccT (UPF0319 family)